MCGVPMEGRTGSRFINPPPPPPARSLRSGSATMKVDCIALMRFMAGQAGPPVILDMECDVSEHGYFARG
jgi:hypothetical protein